MLTVHHLSNSHSHVVLWLLEELGVPYDIVHHQRDPMTARSPDSLRAVHPAAKSPTIVDQGVTMIESAAIIHYVLETYGEGRLRPAPGTPEAMGFLQWLSFIEGSAKGPLLNLFFVAPLPADDQFRQLTEGTAASVFGLIEAALTGQETIVPGMFTAADIQLTFFEELMEAWGRIEPYPNMQRHLAAMRLRDAYKRAEAKGGPVGQKELFSGVISKLQAS